MHTLGLRDGERRAVQNIQRIETALHVQQTTEYKPATYVVPLQLALIMATILYFIAGFVVNRA